eukprot:481997_1
MFSSKKKKKPIQSNTNGVGLDEHGETMQKVMSGELDPTSVEVMSALGIREFDATALENDPALLRELESICKDGDTDNKSAILSRTLCKYSDNSSCEIEGSNDEYGGVEEEELYAQVAALSDCDIHSEEENNIGTAQVLTDDELDTNNASALNYDEDNYNSLGDAGKRGKATSTGNNDETELIRDMVSIMKQEAHALYSRGDKKGALTKLRECKAIEHELAVDRALNTARDLAAPPVITPSSPSEKIMTTNKEVLSGQQQLSSHSVLEDQNVQHQQQKLERKQSGQTATLRELKIKAMRTHRTGDKAKAIALLKEAKSIENRLLAQDPNEKDIPAQMSSSRRNSSLNRSNSSTSGHRVVTSWKSFDDLSLPSSSIALKENVRYGKSEYCDKWNNTSVFDAFVIVLETALESYYAKAKTLAVEDRIAAKKELQKCKPLEVHLEKALELRNIHGASPPTWQWQQVQKQWLVLYFVTSHNVFLHSIYILGKNKIVYLNSNSNFQTRPKVIGSVKEDEVGLEIVSIDGMQVDEGYISVQYDLGYIRGDEAETCQGKTDRYITLEKHTTHSGRGAQLGYRMTHPLVRSSRTTQLAFRNRKACFEVYYHKRKGWLAPKPELFGKAVLPLASLLHSCELEEPLRLRCGHRASSLAVLHVKLSVRTPLNGPELVLVEEKQLAVGEWPNIILAASEVHPIHQMKTENMVEGVQNPRLKINEKPLPPSQQHTPTTDGPDFSILTEQEKCFPFAPEVRSFSLWSVFWGMYIYRATTLYSLCCCL